MGQTTWGALITQNKEAGGGGSDLPMNQDYDAVVEEAEYYEASTGSDCWKVKFQVTAGPYANRRIFTNIVLAKDSAGSVKWFFKKMGALGLDDAFFAQEPSNDQVADALIDRPCVITVKPQKKGDYKGQPEVSAIKPPTGAAPAVAAPAAPGVPQVAAPAPEPTAVPTVPAPAPAPEAASAPAAAPAEAPPAPPQPGF